MEEGDAKLAWSRLMKKYEPKTAPSRLMLKRKLTGMMTDDELLEHALNSLPKEYELIVAKLEDRLGDKDEPLTIEDLREALNLKYQRMGYGNGGRRQNNVGEGEAAFFAGGFKGKCNSKTARRTMVAMETMAVVETTIVVANVAVESSESSEDDVGFVSYGDVGDVEHLCHVMADTAKNNDDGMIMIADSGASNHMINTKKGMFNCVMKVNERITIGNGKTLKVEMIGKIRAMVLQRNGDKKMI
eukprot:scaffold132_cov59-Cylindrotheca_fusiformis.AAC.5